MGNFNRKQKWKLIYKSEKGRQHVVETFNGKSDAKKELDCRKGLVYALDKSEAKDVYFIQGT